MAQKKSKIANKSKARQRNEQAGKVPQELTQSQREKKDRSPYVQWQAAAIAEATSELAEHIETVGNKTSTLDRINVLRKAIIYTTNYVKDMQHEQRIRDLYDLLKTILVGKDRGKEPDKDPDGGILAYYKCTKFIPNPKEDIEKLRRIAHKLQKLAGDFKEHCPLETMTDELRELAKILRSAGFIDDDMAGLATNATWMLDAIYEDLRPLKYGLTSKQQKARSCLTQAHDLLFKVSEIGRFRRTEQKAEPLRDYAGRLHDIANELDACPPVSQYREFWDNLKKVQEKSKADPPKQEESRTGRSLPLGNTKWAQIFGVSPNKMREIRRSDDYHFKPVGERRWSLPKNELPAEYLAKYQRPIAQT